MKYRSGDGLNEGKAGAAFSNFPSENNSKTVTTGRARKSYFMFFQLEAFGASGARDAAQGRLPGACFHEEVWGTYCASNKRQLLP